MSTFRITETLLDPYRVVTLAVLHYETIEDGVDCCGDVEFQFVSLQIDGCDVTPADIDMVRESNHAASGSLFCDIQAHVQRLLNEKQYA